MVIDAIIYNGERDIFDLRYAILKDVVDEFVVVEFSKTFKGTSKESHPINLPNVSYHFFTQVKDLHPNLPPAFANEFSQRETIKQCLTHLKDNDVVYMGDCDELWSPNDVPLNKKLRLRAYCYYLNQRSSEDFVLGPIKMLYKDLKDYSLNSLRSDMELTEEYNGWHFTNCFPYERVLYKLEEAGHQEYNIPRVKDGLKERFDNNIDYIGRNFKFTIDESDLPSEIINNREKYKHLLK